MRILPFLTVITWMISGPVWATEPDITAAKALRTGERWTIHVTVAHPDTGWDHYADGWTVEDRDGNILGFRKLPHPHVNEQPFTRGLAALEIDDALKSVFIRARCNVDGDAVARYELVLDRKAD